MSSQTTLLSRLLSLSLDSTYNTYLEQTSQKETGFDLVWTTNVLRHVEFLRRLFGLTVTTKIQQTTTVVNHGSRGRRRPVRSE